MLGDYQKEETEYKAIPSGDYRVFLSDLNGDITNEKPFATLQFTVSESGDYEGRKVFKRFYLTPKTLEKFLPWQLGILGMWNDVKTAESFSKGIEKMIDASYELLGRDEFIADISIEVYEGKNGPKERNNIVLKENLGKRSSEFTEHVEKSVEKAVASHDDEVFAEDKANKNKFDPNEELPF